MPVDVIMPRLGLTMEEGVVAAWRVQPGDPVEAGQVLLVVETDKVSVEVEARAAGTLGPHWIGAGGRAPIGAVLAQIHAAGEIAGVLPAQPAHAQPARSNRSAPALPPPPAAPGGGQRRFSSPRARRRARELGVDWRTVEGSGPAGRVVERDILGLAARQPLPAAGDGAPHITSLEAEVDLAALLTIDRRLQVASAVADVPRSSLTGWLVTMVAKSIAVPLGADVLLSVPEDAGGSQIIPAPSPRPLVAVLDLSGSRFRTLHLAPAPGQVAVVALGRPSRDGAACISLTADSRFVTLPLAMSLLQNLVALIEEPLLLLG